MKNFKNIALVILVFSFFGCGEDSRESMISSYRIDHPQHLWKKPSWTNHAVTKLVQKDLLNRKPKDIEEYCPTFNDLDEDKKIYFYSLLMSAMAKKESNFNPDATYKEAFRDRNGKRIVSRGLFQISIESANQRAYGCGFKNTSELHDPYRNIACSVNILSHWIKRDGYIGGKYQGRWKGGARYWAVLRDNSSTKYIKRETARFCEKLKEARV